MTTLCRRCGREYAEVHVGELVLYGHLRPPSPSHPVRRARAGSVPVASQHRDLIQREGPDTDREDAPASGPSPDRPSRKRGVRARTAKAVAPVLRSEGRPVLPPVRCRSVAGLTDHARPSDLSAGK